MGTEDANVSRMPTSCVLLPCITGGCPIVVERATVDDLSMLVRFAVFS